MNTNFPSVQRIRQVPNTIIMSLYSRTCNGSRHLNLPTFYDIIMMIIVIHQACIQWKERKANTGAGYEHTIIYLSVHFSHKKLTPLITAGRKQ